MKAVNNKIVLSIAKEFSPTPGPRYPDEGPNSGEKFRKEILLIKINEAKESAQQLLIDLDNTAGYGTSFLEEAFGGLIRNDNFSLSELNQLIEFKSEEEPYLIDDIEQYMEDAENGEN